MLLVWEILMTSTYLLTTVSKDDPFEVEHMVIYFIEMASRLFAPIIGWIADVKLGRYRVITYGTLLSFSANIMYFLIQIIHTATPLGIPSLVFSTIGILLTTLGYLCYEAAMLPFLTDQVIGANARQLSALVYWYYWVQSLAYGQVAVIVCLPQSTETLNTIIAVPCGICLALIIISDCLCQQWLDRTHKVTNPIKLIIQVLNYTRKHNYPERRSAFTYLDEEHPTRMDFGKNKFGGPYSEEEVEDVKTVLQLSPLLSCAGIISGCLHLWKFGQLKVNALDENNEFLNCMVNDGMGLSCWIIPLIGIPFYHFLLNPLFHKCFPSMLRGIGVSLFIMLVGITICTILLITAIAQSGHLIQYMTCKEFNGTVKLNTIVEWYWKLGSHLTYCIGYTIANVLLLQFAVAQSPDKMKGFTIGMLIAFNAIGKTAVLAPRFSHCYTLCYDLPVFVLVTVLSLLLLVLLKCYKLRERNREINIQAIVEDHYERYMDQEAEYMRNQH